MQVRRWLTVPIAIAVLAVLGPTPAFAGPEHHGKDPVASGCNSDAKTIGTRGIHDTWIEFRYSPRCGTNWIRWPQLKGEAYTTLTSDWNKSSPVVMRQTGNGGAHWTPMVYAPGSTCLTYTALRGTWNWYGFQWVGTRDGRFC